MASSTAVVATETEGAREIIRSGETGYLVPIGDVNKLAELILELLRNKDERIRVAKAAQRFALENFSLERMIAETEAIYKAEVQDA